MDLSLEKHNYYLKMAILTSSRSKCVKRKVGCVIVKNDRVISQGVNGTPKNTKNCNEGGCERCNDINIKSGEYLKMCKCIHAEYNALLFSNLYDLQNATMYITLAPCLECSKGIIQCGISNIFYIENYNENDYLSLQYLTSSNIKHYQLYPK